jgi:hypothetical protein
MRQQRRNFQRHPTIHSVRSIVNRPEQIGGFCQVIECEIKEKIFLGSALFQPVENRSVVSGAVLDGLIKDRRVSMSVP